MIVLDAVSSETFVSNTKNATWKGWTIEIFSPHPAAKFNRNGVYRNGSWGYMQTVPVDSDGLWRVKTKNDKPTQKSRPRR